MILPLFPIALGMEKLSRPIAQEELDFIMAQPYRANTGNLSSDDDHILDKPELKYIKNEIVTHLKHYFDEVYAPKDVVEIYITQSWLTKTEPGDFHHPHKHPNSFISGVFYVHAEGETDKITFCRDMPAIQIMPREWNKYNSVTWWVPPSTGDILFFPSTLEHGVNKTSSATTRVSIAFNTFLKGEIGNPQEYNGLIL